MNAHQRRTARRRHMRKPLAIYLDHPSNAPSTSGLHVQQFGRGLRRLLPPRPDGITLDGHAIDYKLHPWQEAYLDALDTGTGCVEVWWPGDPGKDPVIVQAVKITGP